MNQLNLPFVAQATAAFQKQQMIHVGVPVIIVISSFAIRKERENEVCTPRALQEFYPYVYEYARKRHCNNAPVWMFVRRYKGYERASS
jgi:hypothetical protein